MTGNRRKPLENRLFQIGSLLVCLGTLACLVFFGLSTALSCAIGGGLAAASMHWLSRTVSAVVTPQPTASKRRVLVGYVLRLLLIPLCLYAMLRLHFFSIPAVMAGFAAFIFSVLGEGVLEALSSRSKTNARVQ